MSRKRLKPSCLRPLLWLLLALPAVPMVWPVLAGAEEYRHAIRPSGAFSAQLILLALSVTPLRLLFPRSAFVAWLATRRRDLGVAAFCYALVHVLFFMLAVGRLDYILAGLVFASMWTGWLAFLFLAALASTSNPPATRLLGPFWKKLHRLAYPAAVLVLAHWLLLTASPWTALAWFAPLGVLQAMRIARHMGDSSRQRWRKEGG